MITVETTLSFFCSWTSVRLSWAKFLKAPLVILYTCTGCSKMVDPILYTYISETTRWIIMKLNTIYVEGHKFYWLNLQRKVQIFVGSMTDFHTCLI